MKKIVYAAIFIILPVLARAQAKDTAKMVNNLLKTAGDSTWVINSLVAPSSPGASLIGIATSSIQRPTDPSAFSTSLLNATNNLSAIPSSYAVDFAPAWLFAGRHISFTDFRSNTLGKNIWQSLDISVAYKNVKDSVSNNTNTTLGIGLKISLVRGWINSKALKQVDTSYNILSRLLRLKANALIDYEKAHPYFMDSVNHMSTYPAAAQKIIQNRYLFVKDSLKKDLVAKNAFAKIALDSLKKVGESLDFTRYGWKLDLAGGMSYYFPAQVYANGSLNNAGAWLTGGYEDEKSRVSFLGIVRYLYNPKEAYADPGNTLNRTDLNTFDTGMRLLMVTSDSKFTFGGELIYRSILDNTPVKSSYRYSLSADYQVGKNQLISFVLGRDFDGTVTKSGNLLAALNFIIGFGNTKSIQQ